jgi:ribosomal-protein-alanine N-acetyltransferase
MPSLRTERLLLETLSRDEVAAICDGRRDGRAWAPDYPTDGDLVVAAVIAEAGQYYAETAVLGVYQLREAATGDAIGGIGFLSAPRDGEAEVGYGIAESVRGQGLATEALQAVVQLAHGEGVERVVALTDPSNTPSHRVLERTGFLRDGVEQSDEGEMWRWVHRADPAVGR